MNKNIFALDNISDTPPSRFTTGIDYLDTVLGGGIVEGSTILFAGTTGAGKSTLSVQMAHGLSSTDKTVLYIAGEENKEQIKMRAKRLSVNSNAIFLFEKVNLEEIMSAMLEVKPKVMIVDSLQMLFSNQISNAIGTPSQMRYCLLKLCAIAKKENISIIFIGHSTKEGYIAGLQTLQHMVDAVLFLRLNDDNSRLLKTKKNRFGSTEPYAELFMSGFGLFDYQNPDKPFGLSKSLTLTEEEIKNLGAKNSNFLLLFALEWLKKQAKKEYVIEDNKTFTLTSSHINEILRKHPVMSFIVKPSLQQLEEAKI